MEAIYDVTLVAVQCWPAELLSQTPPDTQEELVVLRALCMDIQRILTCVYGEERFKGIWLIGLSVLIPKVVDVINDWWRRRKDNRAKITMWRRKWVIDG